MGRAQILQDYYLRVGDIWIAMKKRASTDGVRIPFDRL